MKVKSSSHPLVNLFIFGLSTCIIASAFSFDSVLRNLHQDIIIRSLPGSLAFIPSEAVGHYQPPPGPIVYGPLPATVGSSDAAPMASTPSTPENTNENGNVYGLKQALAATESSDNSHESQTHIPSVSEMDAMIAEAQTGSGRRVAVRSLVSLGASIFVSLLHL